MNISVCIAHAIHKELDIIEAIPTIHDVPTEQLETYVERYVLNVQSMMDKAITSNNLENGDAESIARVCSEAKVPVPDPMLRKMAKMIVSLRASDCKEIVIADGVRVFHMRMTIDLSE